MTTQEEGLSKGEENRAAMQAQEAEAEGAGSTWCSWGCRSQVVHIYRKLSCQEVLAKFFKEAF